MITPRIRALLGYVSKPMFSKFNLVSWAMLLWGRHVYTIIVTRGLWETNETVASGSMHFHVVSGSEASATAIVLARASECSTLGSGANQPLLADSTAWTLAIFIGAVAVGLATGVGLVTAFPYGFRSRSKDKPKLQPTPTRMLSSKTCVRCGKALPLDAEYCSECGEKLV